MNATYLYVTLESVESSFGMREVSTSLLSALLFVTCEFYILARNIKRVESFLVREWYQPPANTALLFVACEYHILALNIRCMQSFLGVREVSTSYKHYTAACCMCMPHICT